MSIGSAIGSSIGRAIGSAIAGGGAVSWSPVTAWFAAGEKGVVYDLSQLSSLFQDTAGSTPVTADGQTLKRINDLSGNALHATEATNGPTIGTDGNGKRYALFDGTNDRLITGVCDASAFNKCTIVLGLRKLTDSNEPFVALGANATTVGGKMVVVGGDGSLANYGAVLAGDTSYSSGRYGSTAAPDTSVITVQFDIAGAVVTDEIKLYRNGVAQTRSAGNAGPAGGGNFSATDTLRLGWREYTSQFGNFWLYAAIVRFSTAASSAADIAKAEAWCAARSGVTL